MREDVSLVVAYANSNQINIAKAFWKCFTPNCLSYPVFCPVRFIFKISRVGHKLSISEAKISKRVVSIRVKVYRNVLFEIFMPLNLKMLFSLLHISIGEHSTRTAFLWQLPLIYIYSNTFNSKMLWNPLPVHIKIIWDCSKFLNVR